jgi:CheY-like chemotaxis protein
VRGDATELREVLANLLKNSIEALDTGGSITLSVARSDRGIHLCVSDTGPGIAPEDLERLFVPFFTTKGERGTGLGLCLTQQIVERHGGEIRIDSTPGSGTTANVWLPEARTGEPTDPERRAVLRGAASNQAVLVVDDDPDVLSILSAYLQRCGYQVRSAATAAEGLAAVTQSTPDVVISDIAMPEMDGIELCRALRARNSKMPVILMSGHASAIEPDRIRKAGATALLAKPFTMKEVVELLRNLSAKEPQKSNQDRPS